MSPRNSKLVQYGKRSSTKHQKPSETSIEPLPKRRKLMEEEDEDEDEGSGSYSQPQRSDLAGGTVETVKQLRSTSLPSKSRILDSFVSPRRTPTRTYTSESRTTDASVLIPTRSNTPTRSLNPATPTGSHIVATPSRRLKDLSGIFAPLPQLTSYSLRSPSKSITKRMLVRSCTEPSLTSPSSSQSSLRSPIKASSSLPSVTPTSPQHRQRLPSPPSPLPAISKPHLRTYSQSRSFLVALPNTMVTQELSSFNAPLNVADNSALEPDDGVRESYTDLRNRWGVDHSEDDPCHVPGVANDLMSITELRSKGESRRFLDEVGYLFEGLEDPGMAPSVRRSSAAEIVLKMCDPEFVRKAKAADFISHAWDAMRHVATSNDKVLDPYLVFFVALVARDQRDLDDLSRKVDFFDMMLRLLQTRRENDSLILMDDAHALQAGFVKAEQLAISNLRNIIVNKFDSLASPFPSVRLLASYALSRITPSLYPKPMLSTVLNSLVLELSLVRPRLNAYTSGMALLPETVTRDIPDLEHIDHCLKIIDAFLISPSTPAGATQLDEERENLATGLVALCVVLSLVNLEIEQHYTTQCIESNFRVLINLSHLSVGWCKTLISDPLLPTVLVREILSQTDWLAKEAPGEIEHLVATDIKMGSLDRQCLALALLSNVVLAVDDTRRLFRETVINPSCHGGRRCAFSCRCSVRLTAIECFVSFFVRTNVKPESSQRLPELDFFRCHLAALLCLLTFEDPVNQSIVRRALPGVDLRDKTEPMSDSIRLFLEFYTERGHVEFGIGSSGSDMTTRVVSGLKALCT